MKLKRERVSLKEEKRLVTNLITSTEFLKQTKGIIRSYLLKSGYAKIVAGWCLEYFTHTGTAPGKDIQDIYIRRRKEVDEEEEVELISEFLQTLNDDWMESQINNVTYEVSNCIKYMKLRQLEQLKENLDTCLIEGTPDEGEALVANYKNIKSTESSGVDIFKDADKVRRAFSDQDEILFTLQGDLGRAIGPICRGDFVLGMGGPKSGKTYALGYIGHRAALSGLRVLRLNFEMSEHQDTRRAWMMFQGRPRYDKKISIPYFKEKEKRFLIQYSEEKFKGVDLNIIEKEQKKYNQYLGHGQYRSETFIEGESNFSDAVIRMENLAYYDNFEPDVIIWDYPDIMAPDKKTEYRHALDDTYKKIRGYAQKKNCACIAVTQVNSKAWGKDIKGKDADENKKKVNHATKVFAINSTEEEMDTGLVRIQSLYEREGKRFMGQVVVLQCLDIGRFYLDSKFRNKVIFEDE